jgi:predicted GNAT family N-acyltransferase
MHALGFYQGLGFEVSGEPFMEAGIPHLPMRLTL